MESTSNNKVAIIAMLITAVCLALFYTFYLKDLNTKILNTQGAIAEKEAELSELQQYQDNKQLYAKKLKENNEKLIKLIDSMPNNIDQKSILAYYYDEAKESALSTPSLVYNNLNVFNQIDYTYAEGANTITLLNREISLAYSISYDGLKSYIRKMTNDDLAMKVKTVALSPDESGALTGTITIEANAVKESTRLGIEYNLDGIPTNLGDNIFGEFNTEPVQSSIITEDNSEASGDENNGETQE